METTRFMQVVEMTDEEKFAMYMKLTKAEIVKMHIELEKVCRSFSSNTKTATESTFKTSSITTKKYPFTYTRSDSIQ